MKRFFLTLAVAALSLGTRAQQLSPDSISMYDEIQKIEVVATRATSKTPVAYTNLSREDIARSVYQIKYPHRYSTWVL